MLPRVEVPGATTRSCERRCVARGTRSVLAVLAAVAAVACAVDPQCAHVRRYPCVGTGDCMTVAEGELELLPDGTFRLAFVLGLRDFALTEDESDFVFTETPEAALARARREGKTVEMRGRWTLEGDELDFVDSSGNWTPLVHRHDEVLYVGPCIQVRFRRAP